VENAIVSEEKSKPVFDEQTLAKLLEAAYVLQEHGHELRALEAELGLKRDPVDDHAPRVPDAAEPAAAAAAAVPTVPAPEVRATLAPETSSRNASLSPDSVDHTSTLGQVAEIQQEVRNLRADDAMSMLAGHLIEICGAAGAAIGITDGNTICYRAVAGIRALPLGSSVPLDKAFCFPCVCNGEVFRCPDMSSELPIDLRECRRRGIGSFIAVPVFREGGIAGGLELYYSDPRAFSEQDVQTCQLMAGIVTEALARQEKSLLLPSSILPPQLPSENTSSNSHASMASVVCYKCGHNLIGKEQFCGQCGAARSDDREPVSMQSKVASLWHMQHSSEDTFSREDGDKFASHHTQSETGRMNLMDSSALASEVPINMRPFQPSRLADVVEDSHGSKRSDVDLADLQPEEDATGAAATPDSGSRADWSSALSARDFLEQFAAGNRRGALAKFWNARRGDIYLGLALILVLAVIRWGLWPNHHPVNATSAPKTVPTATHKPPAAPEVSILDRMLISLGLAEAPEPPEDKGNPATAVWVDLRTGLYYCPSADLYGKTQKGKYTSQRDAQLDQFQPAYHKACD